jgi:arginine decarboxylase
MNAIIPQKMFFTKGVGHHRNKLQSFELALRSSGIECCNLVYVSSIFPPACKIISRPAGIKLIKPGQITFVVMAKAATNEPNRLVAASIGLAQPIDSNQYGYISEHHAYGETQQKASDFAEDLAATMLASTLGIELDIDKAWNERKQLYITDKDRKFKSRSIAQTAAGNKDGLWTTALACAVMLID